MGGPPPTTPATGRSGVSGPAERGSATGSGSARVCAGTYTRPGGGGDVSPGSDGCADDADASSGRSPHPGGAASARTPSGRPECPCRSGPAGPGVPGGRAGGTAGCRADGASPVAPGGDGGRPPGSLVPCGMPVTGVTPTRPADCPNRLRAARRTARHLRLPVRRAAAPSAGPPPRPTRSDAERTADRPTRRTGAAPVSPRARTCPGQALPTTRRAVAAEVGAGPLGTPCRPRSRSGRRVCRRTTAPGPCPGPDRRTAAPTSRPRRAASPPARSCPYCPPQGASENWASGKRHVCQEVRRAAQPPREGSPADRNRGQRLTAPRKRRPRAG